MYPLLQAGVELPLALSGVDSAAYPSDAGSSAANGAAAVLLAAMANPNSNISQAVAALKLGAVRACVCVRACVRERGRERERECVCV